MHKVYTKIQFLFGEVLPNFELLGSIDVDILKEFLTHIYKLANHKTINPVYFVFLRLFIAYYQNNFKYCIDFNTRLLKRRGYDKKLLIIQK